MHRKIRKYTVFYLVSICYFGIGACLEHCQTSLMQTAFFCEEKSAIIDVISVSPHKKSFLYGQIRRAEKVNTEYVTMQDCKNV